MIDSSRLTRPQKATAKAIFQRLGEAEAKVHGTDLQKVHFHEVGAVDSIADIVGVAIGLDLLGVDRVVCSPIPTGGGYIQIAHGRCRVPAPATAEILLGVPLAASDIEAELTTPTGAAIATTVAQQFGSLPEMMIQSIGYGAGDRDFPEHANLLRLMVGAQVADPTSDQIAILETNLDKITGEVIGHCSQLLLQAGALDVYATAIQMKKNRPATKLTVLCPQADVQQLESILFRETGTLGVRRWSAARHKLHRQVHEVTTPWGPVKGKLVELPNGERFFSPEYEHCRQVAAEHNVALQKVLDVAKQAPMQ
jgi:uncharacterized protein (TIGR00299 family) protein